MEDARSDEGPSLFKPKVIVILSRFPFFDLFRVMCGFPFFQLKKEPEFIFSKYFRNLLGQIVANNSEIFELFNDRFQDCLNRILLALLEPEDKAELMISTLLSQIYLTPGMPAVSFCLGNDRLSVRAPKLPTIPVTSDKVTLFLQQLGLFVSIWQNIKSFLSQFLPNFFERNYRKRKYLWFLICTCYVMILNKNNNFQFRNNPQYSNVALCCHDRL